MSLPREIVKVDEVVSDSVWRREYFDEKYVCLQSVLFFRCISKKKCLTTITDHVRQNESGRTL